MTSREARIWCVRDTLSGVVYPQPNRTIAEKVAEMHGHCEVFEKAQTQPKPNDDLGLLSDDEREVSKQKLCERCGWALSGHLRSQYGLDCPPGGARPGFRRSEVPEPQGEPSDVRLMARGGGKTQAMIDGLLAQANERGIRVEVVYPQGEPSDTQVLAALNGYYGGKHPVSERFKDLMTPNMRAALRAANDVATNHEIERQSNG